MKDIDLYDSAKAITQSCEDIDAVMTVMENAEDSDDESVQRACLAAARCALTRRWRCGRWRADMRPETRDPPG